MQTQNVAVHLVPIADLGKLCTRCLACGAPLDLSHTRPRFRYAVDEAQRAALASSAGAHACTATREAACA